MSSIHFKFRSSSEYEPLVFDGHCISLKDLRDAIITKKKLGKSADFKLEVTNSATEKEYINDNDMIPKNTSLIIRRVPVHYEKPVKSVPDPKNILTKNGNHTSHVEQAKLYAIMNNTESLPDITQDLTKPQSSKIPICFHCKQNGHVIRNCPIVQRQSFGKEPVHVFLKNSLGMPSEKPSNVIREPVQIDKKVSECFICPLCKNIFIDAVLIPCCGSSFCENCISNYLVDNNLKCPTCKKSSSIDDLVCNLQLRKSVVDLQTGWNTKTYSTVSCSTNSEVAEVSNVSPILTKTDNSAPNCTASPPLTCVNNMPILNNLLSSIPFTGINLSTAPLLVNPLLTAFKSLQATKDNTTNATIFVTAPFLTERYANSVVSGDRILTRDEFYSLKSIVAKQIRKVNNTKEVEEDKTKSSSRLRRTSTPRRSSRRSPSPSTNGHCKRRESSDKEERRSRVNRSRDRNYYRSSHRSRRSRSRSREYRSHRR